jgi:hypothetical protein
MRRAGLAAAGVGVVALVAAAVAWAGPGSRNVQMLDNCDGPSFNAAIGPGTCTRNGGLTFQKFFGALARGGAPSWRFSPGQLKLNGRWHDHGAQPRRRVPYLHSGGGVRRGLYSPAERSIGADPCTGVRHSGHPRHDRGGAGRERDDGLAPAGTHRFMCLIHPWMKTTVTVG